MLPCGTCDEIVRRRVRCRYCFEMVCRTCHDIHIDWRLRHYAGRCPPPDSPPKEVR